MNNTTNNESIIHMNNYTISPRNNQAFSEEYSNRVNTVLNTLSEWYLRGYSKVSIFNYIIKNIACYGANSHPSQTTIGRHAGVQRGWVNIVTNELVAMGLLKKTRVIIDGEEQACEYALTDFMLCSDIMWKLKEIFPYLKLLAIFKKKEVHEKADNTPYMFIYFKNNFKIIITNNKSKKIVKTTMQQEKIYNSSDYYDLKQEILDQKYKKEEEEKLMQASENPDFVNFLQGLLNGSI